MEKWKAQLNEKKHKELNKMTGLKVKEKDIVAPGEVLAAGMDFLPAYGTIRDGDDIVSLMVGAVQVDGRVVKVMPFNGKYLPKPGDLVIGKVMDMSFSNWYLDLGDGMTGILSIREVAEYIENGADLNRIYKFGDYVVVKVIRASRAAIDVTMKEQGLRKLGPGRVLKVGTTRVPRIIGKQGSMISMIKEKTKCRLTVGKNGLVWIQGEPADEMIAAEAVQKINDECYKDGLTESIEQLIDARYKK